MKVEEKLSLAEVFVGIRDPRQAGRVEHDLVEFLVVAVCAVLSGADDFVEIEMWAKEKLTWFQRYLKLEHGIPSHERAAWPWATPLPEFSRQLMRPPLARRFSAG